MHLNRAGEWPETASREALLHRAAREALDTAGGPLRGEISVTFLPEGEIRELNRRYLEKDRPTDVLAFDLGEEDSLLGDVYIAPEMARRAAAELGLPVEEELVRLVVHGVLHLLGHEHPEDGGRYRSAMFRLQEGLVGRLVAQEKTESERRGRVDG